MAPLLPETQLPELLKDGPLSFHGIMDRLDIYSNQRIIKLRAELKKLAKKGKLKTIPGPPRKLYALPEENPK